MELIKRRNRWIAYDDNGKVLCQAQCMQTVIAIVKEQLVEKHKKDMSKSLES